LMGTEHPAYRERLRGGPSAQREPAISAAGPTRGMTPCSELKPTRLLEARDDAAPIQI
jgi:hypothetical protein